MTPAPFVEFCHYLCALVAAHTYQDWVGEPVSEQLSVNESVLDIIFLYFSGLYGFQREYPISKVALVGRHPGFSSFDQADLQ